MRLLHDEGRRAGAGSAATSLLHWDIKADGTVTAVKLAESDLGAWPIEKCLLDVARAATFDKPRAATRTSRCRSTSRRRAARQIWDEDKALRAVGGQLGEARHAPVRRAKKAKSRCSPRRRT